MKIVSLGDKKLHFMAFFINSLKLISIYLEPEQTRKLMESAPSLMKKVWLRS